MKQLVTYQIYSMSLYKQMTFRSSVQDRMKLYCLQVKYPYKKRICESVELQTVLALCDQEIDRATPSYQGLKTLVRRHVDQMIRTRNFRARNEMIETWV